MPKYAVVWRMCCIWKQHYFLLLLLYLGKHVLKASPHNFDLNRKSVWLSQIGTSFLQVPTSVRVHYILPILCARLRNKHFWNSRRGFAGFVLQSTYRVRYCLNSGFLVWILAVPHRMSLADYYLLNEILQLDFTKKNVQR